MRAKLLYSCLILFHPMDYSPPGSSVHRILQAGILEWISNFFSKGSSQPVSPALARRFFTTEPPGKPHLSSLQSYHLKSFHAILGAFRGKCLWIVSHKSIQWIYPDEHIISPVPLLCKRLSKMGR